MKKLLLIGLLLPATHCFSQSLMQGIFQRIGFGITAGANYSNFVNTNFNTNALVGYHAGAFVDFRVSDHFSVQEEFLFSTQGAKIPNAEFGKDQITMNYFTVPILFRYRFSPGIYIEAGPQAGMLINYNIDKAVVNNFAKTVDISAAAGLGFQLKRGFGIGLRYVAGLSQVGNFTEQAVKPDFRNSVMQASVYYKFR
jgi:hypothetical protein